jgi:hypothetical protein
MKLKPFSTTATAALTATAAAILLFITSLTASACDNNAEKSARHSHGTFVSSLSGADSYSAIMISTSGGENEWNVKFWRLRGHRYTGTVQMPF